MHYWPNPSIAKTSTSMGRFKGNRPKGISDDTWKAMVAEELLNKQILLDCVPKTSRRAFGSGEDKRGRE